MLHASPAYPGVFLSTVLPDMWLGHAATCIAGLAACAAALGLHLVVHNQDPGFLPLPASGVFHVSVHHAPTTIRAVNANANAHVHANANANARANAHANANRPSPSHLAQQMKSRRAAVWRSWLSHAVR
jgi:hypothetical protein